MTKSITFSTTNNDRPEKIYTVLCALFAILIITGNLIYQKFVCLPILPFYTLYTFELSVGAILYPLTFLLTDLITEFYGTDRANFCVKMALVLNTVVSLIMYLMDSLEATSWSKIDNATFHQVFGSYSLSFLSSLLACYIAQILDINIYLWIRKLTGPNYLWVRSNGSTAISLFIDTTIVISLLCYFGILPADKLLILIFNSYLFKLFFSISSVPLFYAGIFAIRFLLADKDVINCMKKRKCKSRRDISCA